MKKKLELLHVVSRCYVVAASARSRLGSVGSVLVRIKSFVEGSDEIFCNIYN